MGNSSINADATRPDGQTFAVVKSEDQWREELSDQEFYVLRQAGTEAPFIGEYTDTKTEGVYSCKACNAELFRSTEKFDSHCGWPSFDACEPGTIIERPDHSLGRVRTEILCANCGGHLGHVFEDGPTDTGLRYCVNSLSIDFTPED